MEEKTFGTNYDSRQTLDFFRRWWKILLVVFIIGAAASVVASLLVTPRYKASAILFPTSSNRGSKAVLADRYSLDFMDYGIERDCEYAIQIISSQSMEDDVCRRFGMMEHYGISPDDPQKMFKLHETYRSNVSVKRTEFLGVEIGVLDVDPQWAADIANYMAANYDSLSTRIQHQRAEDAYHLMSGVCEQMQQDLYRLEDSLKRHPQYAKSLTALIENKAQELSEIQTRTTQTKVDLDNEYSYKFWLDQARPADKKAYPKRAVIVLLGTFGALLMAVLVLIVVERTRKEKKSE